MSLIHKMLSVGAIFLYRHSTQTDRFRRRIFKPSIEALESRLQLAAMTEVPLVGGVSNEIAKIMVRTDESALVAVEYSTDPSLTAPSSRWNGG